MGYKFTPTTSGKITRLGGFFNGTKTVKLFDASYNLLASATVTANNTWGYTAITPVNVAASSVYYVAVDLQGTGGAWGSLSVPATCSTYITITTGVYEGGSTFDINHTEAGSYIYGMADIYFKLSGAGDNWVEATSGMPWAQRNGWGCVVFNNKIWIIGGDSGGVRKNDVMCAFSIL